MWKFIEDVVSLFLPTQEGIFLSKKLDLILLLAIALLEGDEYPTQSFILLTLALLEKHALKKQEKCKKKYVDLVKIIL